MIISMCWGVNLNTRQSVAAFPFILAYSLGRRDSRRRVLCNWMFIEQLPRGIFKKTANGSPSPKGEGRGEGKQGMTISGGVVFQTDASGSATRLSPSS